MLFDVGTLGSCLIWRGIMMMMEVTETWTSPEYEEIAYAGIKCPEALNGGACNEILNSLRHNLFVRSADNAKNQLGRLATTEEAEAYTTNYKNIWV